MNDYLKNIFKNKSVWIILAIMLLGIFLRTYKFHDWLDFGSDQANDAIKVSSVVDGKDPWPLLGPSMSGSGDGLRENRFHLGPMYYYFEITSAKIFGNYPDKLAYPDLSFSVLSLPLFYFFVRRYFRTHLSIALTGLYAISFYSLKFSHSAWNPNSIPFFVLLFLLSLLEFLVDKEKTRWIWIILAGISLGVGIQLHAILLVLLPVIAFCVFLYLVKINWRVWTRWAVILLVVVILNSGQLISEKKTNFANSKIFFASLNDRSSDRESKLTANLEKNIDCHIEANTYMLTSMGQDSCSDLYINALRGKSAIFFKKINGFFYLIGLIAAFLFSVSGYGFLIYYFRNEKEKKKKYFLGLIILYISISFFVMLPMIKYPSRYFLHLFFVPFLFLGFLINFLVKKYPKKYAAFVILIFLFIISSNYISIRPIAKGLVSKTRSGPGALVLGEIEPMVDYIIAQSYPHNEAYLDSSRRYANFFKSLSYLASKRNFHLTRASSDSEVPQEEPLFYIMQNSPTNHLNKNIINYKNFGQTRIYKLAN